MENPIDTRYILIAFPGVQRVSITEFCAYYADAATHYAKESELELQPDPDDDPTYYPEIEYMTPTATVNNLKFTQSNPDNPSEYTFETTGGDSWVHLAPLKKQAAGTVLVFQYKSTGNLRCEFFWIKPGAPRPAGGVETFFDIKKTDEWKTFKMNMANDWIKTDPNNGKFNGGMEFLVILSVSTSVMEPVRQSLSDSCTGVPPRKANKPSSLTL